MVHGDSEQNKPRGQQKGPLIEGKDFVWEDGRMVLTADYLRRRGYCCESGCRNCPYGFKKRQGEGL